MEQGKRVRFSTKERPGETRAQRPGEQDVMSGSAEETKVAATRTGRRSAGLIRGGMGGVERMRPATSEKAKEKGTEAQESMERKDKPGEKEHRRSATW